MILGFGIEFVENKEDKKTTKKEARQESYDRKCMGKKDAGQIK